MPLYEKWSQACAEGPPKFNHDLARHYASDAEMDLRFLKRHKGELRIAYFLHHLLDLCEENYLAGQERLSRAAVISRVSG